MPCEPGQKEVCLIRASIGTAGVLGLARLPMAAAPTTAYLLLGGRCVMNCAFCAQARESEADDGALSRITWPEFALGQICARLRQAEQRGTISRCCIQVTTGSDVYHEALCAVRALRRSISLPISVAILPADITQVEELVKAGVDRIGLGLDAACERIFRLTKGPHWGAMLATIESVARRLPGIASIHLIVGLGESEYEMVQRMLWVRDLGLSTGLFAFTPVQGTALASRPQPPLSQYRRMQAVRRLILHGARIADFAFDERGTMTGINPVGWRDALASGEAFRTSGCPACNRPFYNERPGGTMYNYARPLTTDEAQQALAEMEIE